MDSNNSAEASVVAAEKPSTAEIDSEKAVHKHTSLKTNTPTRQRAGIQHWWWLKAFLTKVKF